MTVLNDRPQAGAVISEGEAELLVMRRLYFDDERGVGEALNETDRNGEGLPAVTRHRVHFTDYKKEGSDQYLLHKYFDMPMELFFSKPTEDTKLKNAYRNRIGENERLEDVTVRVMPVDKNVIMVRITNLDDKFNKEHGGDLNARFNKRELFEELYKTANDGEAPASYNATRLSLTGIMTFEEMQERRLKWKADDDWIRESEPEEQPVKEDEDVVIIKPQQMMTYIVEYTPHKTTS